MGREVPVKGRWVRFQVKLEIEIRVENEMVVWVLNGCFDKSRLEKKTG